VHAWKGLVLRHVFGKCKRYTSFAMGAVINFRSLYADYETQMHSEVKVTGVECWHAWKGMSQGMCMANVKDVHHL